MAKPLVLTASFRKDALIRRLSLPHTNVFVDLGCGKGRALLLAAQHGFRRVIGVDFSPELCETARQNIAIFRRRARVTSHVKVIAADVRTDHYVH